jgi:Protein of unknown function (DUF3431)
MSGQEEDQCGKPLELVVARYNEDLRWLRRVPLHVIVTVYNKGEDFDPELIALLSDSRCIFFHRLENVGREAHTYLTHLTAQYEKLPLVTVFCQGHPFDHAPDFHDRLQMLDAGEETVDLFKWYGFLDETDDPLGKRLFVPWSKNPERLELETGRLYRELFGEESPEWLHFRGGAQFAVTRHAIRARSRDFYQRAHDLCLSVPLAAHSYERIWDRIFGPPVINPADLGPDGVRYLKRIRRLEDVK